MQLSQKTLENIGFSELEAKVYIAMLNGNLKVKELQHTTGIKRPSIYYAISSLEKRGLVGRLQVGEYNQWKVSPLSNLRHLMEEKKRSLSDLETDVEEFIAAVPAPDAETKTKVTYYEGRDAIETIVFNSLYCKDKEIWSIAPGDNFFFEVGPEFATKYVSERKQRGIKTRNLWENVLDEKVIKDLYEGVSDIRIMPKEMRGKFKSTVFIYDDKVMYIAPQKSNYAVIFESKEHAALMWALYETVWAASESPKGNK